jgi:thiamine-phosphate pyrophosphorylase
LLLYYITDRSQFPGDEGSRRSHLLKKIADAARCGVDYIQLREKDLPARELEVLARQAVRAIHEATMPGGGRPATRLLINSRTDIALAAGAEGVHLRSDDILSTAVRQIWKATGTEDRPVVSISCHSLQEVAKAASLGADLALFAPVFQKRGSPGSPPAGLESLRQACRHEIPVLALGGVTLQNALVCAEAGAAGIAAIRLFQENSMAEVVQALRKLFTR